MINMNLNNGAVADVTTTFSAAGQGVAFNTPAPQVGVSVKLVSGTTIVGRLEASNDGGLTWGTVQSADTTVSTVGLVVHTVINTPFTMLRFNATTVTGVALVILSYNNHRS